MKSNFYRVAAFLILSGCAVPRADHFYVLSAQPGHAGPLHAGVTRQVSLHVTLPSVVDREELVLSSSDQVIVLEHERWASPLLDQLTSTLGQDLEARRADLVVTNRNLEQSGMPVSSISVEVVRMTAELGGQLALEVRWRILDPITGEAVMGRDVFSEPVKSTDYSQLASTLSRCVAQFADKLIASLPAAQGVG